MRSIRPPGLVMKISPNTTSTEAKHGKISAGSLVILNTGWHKRFIEPKRYINMDADKVMRFPGFG